jgi:DNA-binding transcriptional LysR family regulator
MTLEQLRVFVAVAHLEHFTRAAERLKISQSAVSGAISALETEHSLLFFDRTRRHVELTAVGNVFLAEAEAILARVDLALRRIEDLSELRIGKLAVAASQTTANYWLPPLVDSFRELHPGVNIDLWHGNSADVEKRVLRGQADFGIIEQDPNDQTLNVEVLASDTLVAIVGPKHPWFDRDRVEWNEITQTSWIMRELGSGTRALFEAALVAHGISPENLEIAMVFRNGEAIRNAVTAGSCAAVISNLVADIAIKAGTLRRLEPISIIRNFLALSLPGRPQTRASAALLGHLQAQSRKSQARIVAINPIARSDSIDRRRV